MTTWHHLPPKIQDEILGIFCLDIVATCEPFRTPRVQKYFCVCSNWVRHPKCLKDFSSVMQTCRFFYCSILDSIRIDLVSPFGTLQSLQRAKLDKLLELYSGITPPPRSMADRNVGQKCWPILAKSINLQDPSVMDKLVSARPYESLAFLLPHLGERVEASSRSGSSELQVFGRAHCASKGAGSPMVSPWGFDRERLRFIVLDTMAATQSCQPGDCI